MPTPPTTSFRNEETEAQRENNLPKFPPPAGGRSQLSAAPDFMVYGPKTQRFYDFAPEITVVASTHLW